MYCHFILILPVVGLRCLYVYPIDHFLFILSHRSLALFDLISRCHSALSPTNHSLPLFLSDQSLLLYSYPTNNLSEFLSNCVISDMFIIQFSQFFQVEPKHWPKVY